MRRPTFIAQQAARPSGFLGRVIASIMVRETDADNRAAIEALAVQPGEHVLDVGCGSGRSLELLVPLVRHGSVSGIDPSPLMVKRAHRRNDKDGGDKVLVQVASVESLPFEDQTFDAIMSVHTLYFWRDLGLALRELARVLRPGGRLALVFRTSANSAAKHFPDDVYAFRSFTEVAAQLASAGFSVQSQSPDEAQGRPAILTARPMRSGDKAPSIKFKNGIDQSTAATIGFESELTSENIDPSSVK